MIFKPYFIARGVGSMIVATTASAQVRSEVIRGRVTTDSGKAIPAATVIATMAPDRTVFRTVTDSAGMYRLVIESGSGDYLVYITAVGRTAFRKRVTRSGLDSIFVVDARLVSTVQQLSTVVVKVARPKPNRGADGESEATPGDRAIDGVPGALPPDLAGDLAALAGTMPGFLRTADGLSVLGLPAAQSSVTVSGMGFPGADLPRDVRVNVRASTSPFDPARGWFSAGNVNVDLMGAGVYDFKRAHATVYAPASPGAGLPEVRGFSASYGADGPLNLANTFLYNLGLQASRQLGDATSLLTASPTLIREAGVSGDSVTRFLNVLSAAGVPLSGVAGARPATESGSLFARFESNERDMRTMKLVPTVYGLAAYAKGSRSEAIGLSPAATPSRSGRQSQSLAYLYGTLSHYFGEDYLVDAKSTLSVNQSQMRPSAEGPGGRVLVRSDFSDGAEGVAQLAFGGNGMPASDSRQLTWETITEAKFYAQAQPVHRIKVTTDLRYDGLRRESASSGTFTFSSLAALENGSADSYARNIGALPASAGVWNAFAAVGDLWRVNPRLQLNYGMRLEGAVVTAAGMPGSVHASPRLGFIYKRMPTSNAFRQNDLGFYRVGPSAYLRGGIGEFRNITSASPALEAIAAERGGVTLSCIGSATPTPNWSAYAVDESTVPTSCVGGAPSNFVDNARATHVFASGFAPPRSWRGNLAYATRAKGLDLTVDGTVSYNLDQWSRVDRNLLAAPAFIVSNEGRAVYAPASAIVPTSGAVSRSASRIDPASGPVIEHRSDLRSVSRQLTAIVTPDLQAHGYLMRFAYTLASSRAAIRGLDGTTFGPVADRDWARGVTPRHEFLTQFGYGRAGVTITGLARVTSGRPFTPMVASDVNGDGVANDRAFIQNPDLATDPAIAAGMRTLMESGPSFARDCLTAQRDIAAGHNSCSGPWTSGLDATLRVNKPSLRNRRIASIDLSLTNVLSGIDAALHGPNGMRGWGQPATPDPVLYFVRGFDPASQRFAYAVNPDFGRTRPSIARLVSPFRLQLDVSMNLGTSIPQQQFNAWVLPGRAGHSGNRLKFEDMRSRYSRQVPDPYQLILQETDSLLLSRTQVDSLKVLQSQYRVRIDSLWDGLARYVDALGDDLDQAAAFHRQEEVLDQGWEKSWQAVHALPGLLNPLQMAMLPGWAKSLYGQPTFQKGLFRAPRP